MKLSLSKLVGIVNIVVVATVLAACAKSGGGGGGGSAPDASATCTTVTNCNIGPGGFVGAGSWKGSLMVSNVTGYQRFLYENNLRGGTTYFRITVTLKTGELPGEGALAVKPVYRGRTQPGVSGSGDALMINGASGFMVTVDPRSFWDSNYGYGFRFNNDNGFNNGFVGMGVPQQVNGPYGVNGQYGQYGDQVLSVTATFTDAIHSQILVVVSYKGQILGKGMLYDVSNMQRQQQQVAN